LNPQIRNEKSISKNTKGSDKTEGNPLLPNPNLNKLNRLKSKDKIFINEQEIKNRENTSSKKPSSAEELIKEAEKEKNKIISMPIISEKSLKKPIIFSSATGALGKTNGPKLVIKKDSDQKSFISNNNSIIDDNLEKRPSNKIIFKQTSIGSNALKAIENRISPNSTMSQLKQNLNNNSKIDLSINNNQSVTNNINNSIGSGSSTQNRILLNKASLNSSNLNSTINSGNVDFKGKINLSNFNNTNTETEKTNNTSFNTHISSNNKNNNNNFESENISNSSSNNNIPNSIFKNLNTSHLRSNSTLSGDSANLILTNLPPNKFENKIKDFNFISTSNLNRNDNSGLNSGEIGLNHHKTNSNKDFLSAEANDLNSDPDAFNRKLVDSEKVLINNKISHVSNMRNNINLKKPAIMGAAYGNVGNSKPSLKTKNEISNNKKPEENK